MRRIASNYNRTFNTKLSVNDREFNCWVAADPVSLAMGLMEYQLQPRQGCLLDFGTEREVGLWMRNCLHPLTAVFANQQGVVIGLAQMSHEDPYRSHSSPSPCRYALELLPSDAEGIRVGDRIYAWVNDE